VNVQFVIITGLSGAGMTQAVRSLEDLGYFCVDNLPPSLIPKFAEFHEAPDERLKRIALVVDRGGEHIEDTFGALENLEKHGVPYQILFIEADDETLVRRYKETRRRHPLAPHGRVLEGITEERKRLEEIRGRAHVMIDTSDLKPQQLRDEIVRIFGRDEGLRRMIVTVVSFGFKYGLPLDADLVFDVRFLPNPQYVKSLQPLDGNHPDVREYLFKWPVTEQYMARLQGLLDFVLPHYVNEGKTQLVLAIGCTGGQHRSVAIAGRLAELLEEGGHTVILEHRDIAKREAG